MTLLESVQSQTLYPDEIIVVDGSSDDYTKIALQKKAIQNLIYFKVNPEDRGLTRQRNFGISNVNANSEVVCFLDDDTVLENDYFEQLLSTYKLHPEAIAVGGYIINEVSWKKSEMQSLKSHEFFFDGWIRKESSRFMARKKLGLDSNVPPGFSPTFSHGRSVSFLPPSGKTYEVEQLMGGVSSFRNHVLEQHQFSTYFDGYGLYEDADFSLRIAKTGKLYLNTNAKLSHFHDASGRPSMFRYGKMVVRNGWYVWRVKNTSPDFKSRFKWHAITILLTMIRFTNILKRQERKEAFHETLGRISGWFSLLVHSPKPE